jgi:hypothetical protein
MTTDRRLQSTIELAESFYKIPALMVYRVRCGKANCHCADGAGHGPYAFLHWRDGMGRQRRRYVRGADVEAVRAIISTRRAERQERRQEAQEARAWLRANTRMLRELLRDLGPS